MVYIILNIYYFLVVTLKQSKSFSFVKTEMRVFKALQSLDRRQQNRKRQVYCILIQKYLRDKSRHWVQFMTN